METEIRTFAEPNFRIGNLWRRGGAGFQGAVMNVGLRVQIGHRQTVTSAHVMVSCTSWFGRGRVKTKSDF